jgi:ribosomal protein S18 acetylase RimI-like enzyme
MRTHTVCAAKLDRFVEAGGATRHRQEVRQYVRSMFDAGCMRPDWCFVIEDGDGNLGRVALWTLPGMDEPLDLVLLDVPCEDPSAGVRLLREVLERARLFGAQEIGHVLDAPPMKPQWQDSPDRRAWLLERAGFVLRRETSRFEWRSESGLPAVARRLDFRALDEVGEEAFVGAIERVSEGTLDREIQDERDELGPAEAARRFFELERKLEYDPAWCRLAYAPDGGLVGLVMPARNPTSAVINYIGVVPEHRGRGYVDDLLVEGTAALRAAGAESVRADADTRNAPMAAAFRRAGYEEFAKRREYGVKLAPLGAKVG